jgi:hypothetical protein
MTINDEYEKRREDVSSVIYTQQNEEKNLPGVPSNQGNKNAPA